MMKPWSERNFIMLRGKLIEMSDNEYWERRRRIKDRLEAFREQFKNEMQAVPEKRDLKAERIARIKRELGFSV